ncbi:phage baseplate protein [Clostridium ihumii]|uniref:phage baseplate protein n=1 Tax=Clostridium ihumii TaxID=1470356 RepID=UPI0005555A8E|nr:hypothetical protein [Clostridium ihumii]
MYKIENDGGVILEYWLKNSIETFQFPINFDNFEVKFGSLNKTINLLNFGEVNITGENKLREWSVSGFFPAQKYSFCDCEPKNDPYAYCKIIDQIKYSKGICRFIATGTRLNNACTIEEFSYKEQDGTGDVYFTISFREHKLVGIKGRSVVI